MTGSFWIETLGCPKNEVDSDHIAGDLLAKGYRPARSAASADLVVVNTCAFIDAARQESIDTILELAGARRDGARLVVTGCLASRAGAEVAEAMPEVDAVVDVGVPVELTSGPRWRPAGSYVPSLDLMRLPRRPRSVPWAYVKIAEGCDRHCGFCAIPSFRGPQQSRSDDEILAEVTGLGVEEVVLVSQDLASYGRDLGRSRALEGLVRRVAAEVARVRLLYLFPSSLTDALIDAIVDTGVAYFDLSLQHVSAPHLRRMRRPGSTARFADKIERIRKLAPDAVLRSSFILGYPGETEEDHDELLAFLRDYELDWVGFFTYSEEGGTYAAGRPDKVAPALALERLRECAELQDDITARKRAELIGREMKVLVDSRGVARSHREAPEIDGVVRVPEMLVTGRTYDVVAVASEGPDLVAEPLTAAVGESLDARSTR